MALMVNLVFVLILALIATFRSVLRNHSWNTLFYFDDENHSTMKYLIQFIYHYDKLTVDFAKCDFLIKIYDSKSDWNVVRIPRSFFRENIYNRPLFTGEKVQFLLITDKDLSDIAKISVNHNDKGKIRVESIAIQQFVSNESQMVMIDKFIEAMSDDDAEVKQIFETIERENLLPESNLSIDSDMSLWIYIGPIYFLLNAILAQNAAWIFRNFTYENRRRARDFIEFEYYQYAISEGLALYMIIAPFSQLIYSTINQIFSGQPRLPGNMFYTVVNLTFFFYGFKLIWKILDPDSILGFQSMFVQPQGEVLSYYKAWLVMNIMGIGTSLFIALPLHVFLYNIFCNNFFFDLNYYDLSVNQL